MAGADFVQQIGVAVEEHEQFDQCERGFGLAVLVARKGIGATAENVSGMALVEVELLADAGDKARIDNGAVHGLVEFQHGRADALGLGGGEHAFGADRAEFAINGGIVVVSPL